MKVLKFGGSSVANPERIKKVIEILKSLYTNGEKFTVVFSAFGGITDLLIDMAKKASKGDDSYKESFEIFKNRHNDSIFEILSGPLKNKIQKEIQQNHDTLQSLMHGIFLLQEASLRTMDYVLSFGERNSSAIIASALQQQGIEASFLDARKIIKTDKNFGSANVDFDITYENIARHYRENSGVQVVTGFVGSTKGGLTTTLGRGGSDYTASLLAAGLKADHLEIWTDVDGVLTADPRKVKKAFSIPSMTYSEAMEMSHFGAKVIYPPTLQPTLKLKIPITTKNTFNPTHRGTIISELGDPNGRVIKGISSINEVSLLTLSGSGLFGVPGIAARLFGSLAMSNINVVLITQGSSEHSISFAIQPQMAAKAKKKVEKEFEYEISKGSVDPVKVENDLSVVAIIGENMRFQPGISGRLFQTLGKNGINCVAIAQGSSELNVSVVINKSDESKALNALHDSFFLSDTTELRVFMAGVGLIGGTLLKQIEAQNAFLKSKRSLEIKVVGLANTKTMVFDENGIDLKRWKTNLVESQIKSDLTQFVETMKSMNLSNSIFVDNTANPEVAQYYENILDASISISTPNKIATSSSYLQYQRLQSIAQRRGVQFLYETNVGAGLPVISTLRDLIYSGDQIKKIEGVLSGSLSFIFNSFVQGTKFSDIVKLAKDKGYTEPDPRDDLNGFDVRRKLIILARETGLPIEAENVAIENILPSACKEAASVEDFFKEIEKADGHFEMLRSSAERDGKKLRMIATLDDGKATIELHAVNSDHPFYSLDGSDNMIVFTTARYKERPLVVRGPGAGAEVTAAGVFAEIISIGNYLT